MFRRIIATLFLSTFIFQQSLLASESEARRASWQEKVGSWIQKKCHLFKRVDSQHMQYVDRVSRNPQTSLEEKKLLLEQKLLSNAS